MGAGSRITSAVMMVAADEQAEVMEYHGRSVSQSAAWPKDSSGKAPWEIV